MNPIDFYLSFEVGGKVLHRGPNIAAFTKVVIGVHCNGQSKQRDCVLRIVLRKIFFATVTKELSNHVCVDVFTHNERR